MPDPQLVDPYGRPVSAAALQAEPLRRSSLKPPPFNPEPEKLKTAFKLADDGDPRQLQQMLAQLEGRDGHFGGVLETRRRAVTRLPWRAVATTNDKLAVDVAEAVQRDILDAPWFRPMVRSLLDAVVKGWSVCQLRWSTGDVWVPASVRWVDQQMTGVLPDDDQRVAWRTPGDESTLQPIEPYTAVVHAASDPSGPLYQRGIGRSLATLYSFKRLGLQAWATFIELYGVARPVASYPPGSKQSDVDEYNAAIGQWMHGGHMVKPTSLKVEFPEPSNSRGAAGGDPVQAGLARWCDEQASKRIIGQTMTSDSGSSLSQAQVHMQVAAWILEADAADLAQTIFRDLVVPYVMLNFGPDAPLPTIGAIIEDLARRLFQLDAIAKHVPLGLRVEQSVVRDLIGIPEPADDAELLEKPAASGAAGTGGAGLRRRGGAGEDFDRQLRAAQRAREAVAPVGVLRSAQVAAYDARRRHGPGARLAAKDDGEDLVDRDAGAAAETNWRRDLQPFVAAAEDAAAGAGTYAEFKRALKKATVDGDKFVRDLATTTMQLRGVGDGTDDV